MSLRWPGTKTGLSMLMVLDPVPAWPATYQLSSMRQAERGTSTKPGCAGAPFSGPGNCAPRMIHSELSALDTNCQRPWMRKPSSTISVVPVGAYDTQAKASGVFFQTSSCASRGNAAISHWWMEPIAQSQAEEVQPRPNSEITSMNAVNPYS